MTRVAGEPALVLHVRPYRESSAIVSLMTLHHGRVAVVARSVRGKRGSSIQPFNRIRASWQGRGSLVTLVGAESEGHLWLRGDALAAGFYVLELISRLVGERESAPRTYVGACWALESLAAGDPDLEIVLRRFELLLLEELGYGLEFDREADSGVAVAADGHYWFDPGSGFRRAPAADAETYSGGVLQAIAAADYASRAARVAAKSIVRTALAGLLGPRPLTSRNLFLRRTS